MRSPRSPCACSSSPGTESPSSARELYEWFLPLLRLDTVPKLVQLIKLAQELTGQGVARVRPPRLEVTAEERSAVAALVETALASRLPAGAGGA